MNGASAGCTASEAGVASEHDAWQDIVALVKKNCVETYAGANRCNPEDMAREFLSAQRIREQLQLIERVSGRQLQGRTLLEVGSATGLLVAEARSQFGVRAYGIDPGGRFYEDVCSISRRVLEHYDLPRDRVVCGWGECLPYPSDSFDIVFSTNVLEHVMSPSRVLRESFRVLKPGGDLVFVVPNYGSWWEGHYCVLWLPNMPRWLARLYLRLLGKNLAALDDLQMVSYHNLQPTVSALGGCARLVTWGQEIWEERMRKMDFSDWVGLAQVRRLVRLLHRLNLVSLAIRIGKRMHWETPLILHIRKLDRCDAASAPGRANG